MPGHNKSWSANLAAAAALFLLSDPAKAATSSRVRDRFFNFFLGAILFAAAEVSSTPSGSSRLATVEKLGEARCPGSGM